MRFFAYLLLRRGFLGKDVNPAGAIRTPMSSIRPAAFTPFRHHRRPRIPVEALLGERGASTIQFRLSLASCCS